MLTSEEIDWLNAYHRKVYDRLSPSLNAEEQKWLKEACAPLTTNQ
jgi:Xaa-Pro aminopeptidase